MTFGSQVTNGKGASFTAHLLEPKTPSNAAEEIIRGEETDCCPSLSSPQRRGDDHKKEE